MTRLRNPAEVVLVAALLGLGLVHPGFAAAAALLFGALEILAGLRGASSPRWLPSAWPAGAPSLTILYDASCRLCVGSKHRLQRWATADRMTFVPVPSAEAKALLPDTPETALLGQMHVLEGGKVHGGADGWFRIMRLAPLWSAWIAWVTPRVLARPVYAWVARNRYRWFGKVCEEGSCAVHPSASGGRRSSTPNDSRGPS